MLAPLNVVPSSAPQCGWERLAWSGAGARVLKEASTRWRTLRHLCCQTCVHDTLAREVPLVFTWVVLILYFVCAFHSVTYWVHDCMCTASGRPVSPVWKTLPRGALAVPNSLISLHTSCVREPVHAAVGASNIYLPSPPGGVRTRTRDAACAPHIGGACVKRSVLQRSGSRVGHHTAPKCAMYTPPAQGSAGR